MLTIKVYEEIVNTFNPDFFKEEKELSVKGFQEWLMMQLNKDAIKSLDLLSRLGYSKNLISKRNRIFNITVHSDENISLKAKDSLAENMDFVANCLMIKSQGKPIDKNQSDQSLVECFYYHNPKINSFSYGVINKTDYPVKATLDVMKSKNLT